MPDDLAILRVHNQKPGATAPRKGVEIDTIVVHYTATPDLPRLYRSWKTLRKRLMEGFLTGSINTETRDRLIRRWEALEKRGYAERDAVALCVINAANGKRHACWHYCIPSVPTGECQAVEYVVPTMQALHIDRLNCDLSLRSIGIENVYPGAFLKTVPRRDADRRFTATGWGGAVLTRGPDGVRYWFPSISPLGQMVCLSQLCCRLVRRFQTIRAIIPHFGHSSKGKIDCDPPYWLGRLRQYVKTETGREMLAEVPEV